MISGEIYCLRQILYMQLTNVPARTSSKNSSAKDWLKILTEASSLVSTSASAKTTWKIAELALKVQTKWEGHSQYNLKALSAACGVSEARLRLQARAAQFFPPDKRVGQLSFTHHIEAMRSGPERADYWLQQALEKRWNGKDIRLAISGNGDPRKYSWLRCGTFWYFSSCDPRFGIKYPGRIPGQIPANVIHYFTAPGDLVVDPMAGGGSTIDAAALLERRCVAYDLVPSRPEIQQNDAIAGLPATAQGAKLIFIDPPYGSIAKGFYEEHPHCLSRMGEEEFLQALLLIGGHCREVLDPEGYLAILVQNVYGWQTHTVLQVMQLFIEKHWELVRRIQVPLPNHQISSNVMKWARENRQMVNTDRDLLVFKLR
jgi:DNA modification methylase